MSTKLIMLRKAAGMTQEQVASLMGIDRSTIAKWETGKAIPRLDKLRKLCSLYGCKLNALIEN